LSPGSGSILAGLRLGVPLLVVPNQSLKDNHQEELANELQRQGYVVATSVEYVPIHPEVATNFLLTVSQENFLCDWPCGRSAGSDVDMAACAQCRP
jgi:UDP-N-acetylglucosamine transferase subunit ALG13